MAGYVTAAALALIVAAASCGAGVLLQLTSSDQSRSTLPLVGVVLLFGTGVLLFPFALVALVLTVFRHPSR
ncbi:hypothetical protein [Fodinicola acaciae]|uniref:hypothetical protein n=1 Tax=Fodinicola acaciae TaxID=2681555 RepID=UPI0013D5208E|nr:hypothetical protein [Fodinicola acaciae]